MIDLQDISTPEELPRALRLAAEKFSESSSELASAWQDENAGRVWAHFARILERAAVSCDLAISKHV
jgi:hypothetical protein